MNLELWRRLFGPRSRREDERRREFILNVLLISAIVLVGGALIINRIEVALRPTTYQGVPGKAMPMLFLMLASLYLLSRARFITAAIYGMLALYFVGAVYTLFTWGVDVPVALLVCALLIVLSGVLVTTRVAFGLTLLISSILLVLYFLQAQREVAPNLYWKSEPTRWADIVTIILVLLVIAMVTWLYNREITKSFFRARASEAALRQERDLLETRVRERTHELEKARLEKLIDLYRQADFGRLAAGLFHDLVTPLNTLLLNLEQLRDESGHMTAKRGAVNTVLQRAIRGTKSMESFVAEVRQQIHQKETCGLFSPSREIKQVLWLLATRAAEAGVRVDFVGDDSALRFYGCAVKFHQLILNLVLNAIDSYDGMTGQSVKRVEVRVQRQAEKDILTVRDWGQGIAPEYLEKIFEPFFTTKEKGRGTGIGLSICRNIVEHDFSGSITVESHVGKGALFTVLFPRRGA